MQALQNDVLSLPAQRLLKLLSQTQAKDEPRGKLLLAWDGVLTRDSPAAALYELWLQDLRKAATEEAALPASIAGAVQSDLPLPVMLRWLEDPKHSPFANRREGPLSARDAILSTSLRNAWQELSKLQGSDPKKWSWGKLHVVRFRHPLDRLPGGDALNLGSAERPGDGYTVNATGFGSTSFEQKGGASFREILDPGDWDRSLAINTPGQSGVPDAKHYSDLLQLWTEGKYFPLLYSREAVEKNLEQRWVLQPTNKN
jgi:penicillin amidase